MASGFLRTRFGWGVAIAVAAAWGVHKGWCQEAMPGGVETPAPVRIEAGAYTVEGSGAWKRTSRIAKRDPDVWSWYMHGVVDIFAQPKSWEEMLSQPQMEAGWLDPRVQLQGNPYRRSPMPSLRLEGGQSIVSAKPLLDEEALRLLGGKIVRVFVWICAEEAGRGASLWRAVPRLDLLEVGTDGRTAVVHQGLMATRGTFPWHCYYRDVHVPLPDVSRAEVIGEVLSDGIERGRGLYVQAVNPVSGRAWFSTLSYEVVDDTNRYAPGDMQDPGTGSLAPHARYDELPVHLASGKVVARGIEPAHSWLFLTGGRAGVVNVPDVMSKAGLDSYMAGAARQDLHHLINGLARLPEWYHTGLRFSCLPSAEDGWLAHLAAALVAAQDTEKGFWGSAEVPFSMAATAALVERCFGGATIARADRPAVSQPWLSCGIEGMPRAEAMLETVLSMQLTLPGARRDKGGWNQTAGSFADAENMAMDAACSVASTADAVYLLRRGMPLVSAGLRARAERAVREGMEQVWRTCVLSTGLWKQTSADRIATHGGFMPRLIDASPMLEHRIGLQLPTPRLDEVSPVSKGRVRIAWNEPPAEAVSLRIYVLPPGVSVAQLGDQHLVGIIQKSDGDVRSMDPLMAVTSMRRAADEAWQLAWFEGYGGYAKWKLDLLPGGLATSLDAQPVTVAVPEPGRSMLYVCIANWYGEVSRPLHVPLKIEAEESAETPPAEGGNP